MRGVKLHEYWLSVTHRKDRTTKEIEKKNKRNIDKKICFIIIGHPVSDVSGVVICGGAYVGYGGINYYYVI